ncbi:hypothetical protein GCM10027425_02920 [Alteromonas gracilis]
MAATTAAPAFAASTTLCGTANRREVQVTTLNKVSDAAATLTTNDPDGSGVAYGPVTIAVSSSIPRQLQYGSANSANVQFSAQLLGGLSSIALHQRPSSNRTAGAGREQYLSRTTFTASRRMYDLSFTLTDIDSTTGDYWDFVYIESSSPFTVSGLGGRVAGSGTGDSPLRATSGNVPVDSNSSAGNATITFSSVSSFTIVYGSYENGSIANTADGGDQVIGIGNMRGFVLPNACG